MDINMFLYLYIWNINTLLIALTYLFLRNIISKINGTVFRFDYAKVKIWDYPVFWTLSTNNPPPAYFGFF